MRKYRVSLIVIALLLMVGCSVTKTLETGIYTHEVLELEVSAEQADMIKFVYLENTLAGGEGIVDYEHVKGSVFKINFGSDTPGLSPEYYALEKEDGIDLIDTNVSLEDIQNGDYTPQFVLKKAN